MGIVRLFGEKGSGGSRRMCACVWSCVNKGNTHSNFNGVLVANETDFRGPRITSDDRGDENEAFIVGSIGSSNVCAIW